jgi:hypothetical protein
MTGAMVASGFSHEGRWLLGWTSLKTLPRARVVAASCLLATSPVKIGLTVTTIDISSTRPSAALQRKSRSQAADIVQHVTVRFAYMPRYMQISMTAATATAYRTHNKSNAELFMLRLSLEPF